MPETFPEHTPTPLWRLSAGPHVHHPRSVAQIMWMVNLSLLPALLWALWVFGWQALFITGASVLGCLGAEQLTCWLRHRRSSLLDGSAVCTGLLLAYTLPPGFSPWKTFVGALLALLIAKSLFGGLGYNLFNIALVGRAILMATFPLDMTTQWLIPQGGNIFSHDALTMATPLATLKEQGLSSTLSLLSTLPEPLPYYWRLILGLRPGSIGEVSVICLGLGAAFLLWKKIITLWIPLSTLCGLWLMALFSPAPMLHVFSGGVWLGAFFMATDYVTSPSMPKGQMAFGLGIGMLTGIIRIYGDYPEGICYAILIMNILTPALEEWFPPKYIPATGVPS